MPLPVVFTPEAEGHLLELYRYIAAASSPDIAARYTESPITYCETLCIFPERDMRRDDLRPGVRLTHYRSRTVVAFAVQPGRIEILGFFHGGRDYERILAEPDEN